MTSTKLGKFGEKHFAYKCDEEGLSYEDCSARWNKAGYDFLVGDKRVEITTAMLSTRNKWYFLTETASRNKTTYDFLFLLGLTSSGIEFELLIPSEAITVSYLTIYNSKSAKSWKNWLKYLLTSSLKEALELK